jgi:predicted O-methyltransferase YrrM
MLLSKPDLFILEYQKRLVTGSDIQAHLEFLHDTVLSYEVPVVLELGVRTGNSTSAFLAAVHQKDGELISVDVNEPDVPPWWYLHSGWVFKRGSDTDETVVREITALHPDFDVLFIDTSHIYGHTYRELETWVPRVRPGGTVLMHDTEYDPMPEETLGVPQPRRPVAVALADYCHEYGLKWENHTGCFGLGVIRIPGG